MSGNVWEKGWFKNWVREEEYNKNWILTKIKLITTKLKQTNKKTKTKKDYQGSNKFITVTFCKLICNLLLNITLWPQFYVYTIDRNVLCN